MPTSQPYYLNAPSLGSATAIFLDAGLTTCAPDGYYSDGVIVRQQVSCVLLPQQNCPSCAVNCAILPFSVETKGYFEISVDMGTATGAIPITFNPFGTPVGFSAEFDGTIYNIFSSPVYGLQQGPSGLPVYLGDSVTSGCDPVALSPITADKYYFDGSSFVSAGTTETFSAISSQVIGDDSPGDCVIVIPKTVVSPSTVTVKVYAPCNTSSFNLNIQCPYQLRQFQSSIVADDSVVVCALSINQDYYVEHVTGVDFELGLYDWVFSDPNGEFKLTKGYYKSLNCPTGYNVFEVDNGIILGFYLCP
jgi:hypothetical protein